MTVLRKRHDSNCITNRVRSFKSQIRYFFSFIRHLKSSSLFKNKHREILLKCEFNKTFLRHEWQRRKSLAKHVCGTKRMQLWHRWRCHGNSALITVFFKMIYNRMLKHVYKFCYASCRLATRGIIRTIEQTNVRIHIIIQKIGSNVISSIAESILRRFVNQSIFR